MELRHLRYFVAAAEEANIGRAARRLHIAQQPLSRQLRDLEREVGVPLFVRHPRGVRLTAAGGEFVTHARDVLARAARAVEHVRRAAAPERTLRVGLVEYGAGRRALLAAVARMRARLPHVPVVVDVTPFTAQPTRVARGTLDVGFYSGFTPAVDGVLHECVMEDALAGALLPVAHPLAESAALTPADFTGFTLLHTPHRGQPAEVRDCDERLTRAGWRPDVPGAEAEVERPAVIDTLVAAGLGWACVPASVAAHAPPGTVYRELAAGGGTRYALHALWRDDRDPLVTAFLAGLRDELAASASAPPPPVAPRGGGE